MPAAGLWGEPTDLPSNVGSCEREEREVPGPILLAAQTFSRAVLQLRTKRLRRRTGHVITHTDLISPSWVERKIELTGTPSRQAKSPGRV